MTVPLIMAHAGGCPARESRHTDPAMRIADNALMHWTASGWDCVNKWVAYKLEDGRSDNTLYDTKRDAIRHQFDEFLCFYVPLHPGGINPCEAEVLLKIHRQIYDNGWRMTDPDAKNGGPDIIPRIGMDTVKNQVRALIRGK